jgi:hypothetical protein
MRLWIVGKLWGAREGALFLCSIPVFADAACSALTTNSLEYGLHPRLKPRFEAKTQTSCHSGKIASAGLLKSEQV